MSRQKVVLVTAGTAGLGAQIARAFAPDCRIVVNYANNSGRAEALLNDLAGIPCLHKSPAIPRFHAVKADVGDRSSVRNLVEETLSIMGHLDIVISNAGWTRITNFANFNEGTLGSDWDTCFLYNVKTHLWLMDACKPPLEETSGAFITTASLAGVKPSGSSLPYAVTKAAQIHLAKSLAVICAPAGIRVNSVSPGLMLTEWGLMFGEEKIKAATERTRLGMLPTVEDVAAHVRTLALSRSTRGQNIVIDSGTSL